MATRDEWLRHGLAALAEAGLPGVRIDRIAAQLGVSKGSFHHHFDGAADYRRAILDRYGEQAAHALERVTSAGEGLDVLHRLVEALDEVYDARLETAVRAWAMHDDEARQAVSSVDRARLRALEAVWGTALPRADLARTAALVPHLVVIGASASPTTSVDDLRAVLRLLVRLVPAVPSAIDGR